MNKKILKNEVLQVEISDFGAELQSIKTIEKNQEYLWHGDAKFWGRRSPVLFPIVGSVVNGVYYYEGKEYKLSQHGFARDSKFSLKSETTNKIVYQLLSNEETLKVYPFQFELNIGYELIENQIKVIWEVVNTDDKDMYFSIGAHPAFLTNLTTNNLEDFYIEFDGKQELDSFKFSDGLIINEKYDVLKDGSKLDLSYDLLKNPLIFEDLSAMTLANKINETKIRIDFDQFPLVAIWSPVEKGKVPFVCIEPWFGLADFTDGPQEIAQKRFINKLSIGEKFTTEYIITIN